MVALLKMIRDVTHNKKERKKSVMAIVKSDAELYTIQQGFRESLDEYYKVFKAQVDTIDAHGGNVGCHPVVYALHLAALLKKEEITKEIYNTMNEDNKKPIQSKAMKTAKEAYLACLFVLMADKERYLRGRQDGAGGQLPAGQAGIPPRSSGSQAAASRFQGDGGQSEESSGSGEQAKSGVCGGREGDGVHPHLPRLRQEVQGRVTQVPAHHRGAQGQGGRARCGRALSSRQQQQQQQRLVDTRVLVSKNY